MKKLLNKYIPLLYGAYFNLVAIFSKKGAAKKAFDLFCTPRRGMVLPQQKAYLESAKKEVVESNNIHLQVYEWPGEKETILVVHGWESNAFRWKNLIGFLQEEKYNIIAFDAPAHGHSSGTILNIPLYAKVMQTLVQKYNPKHIIGHSYGGMTTLYNNYLNSNEAVDKLVILGAPSEFRTILLDYQKLLHFNNIVLEALKDYIKNTFGFEADAFSISEYVKTNTKKGLLIHDKFDEIAPCSDSELVHKNWANSSLIKTEGFGHSLHQEEVSRAIVKFLKEN